MKSSLFLLALAILLSACGSSRPIVEDETISPVLVPQAPKKPDVAPVETAVRELDKAVTSARGEVARAEQTLTESKRMSDHLRQVVDSSYEEADEASRRALALIREAASQAAQKLDTVTRQLSTASEKLLEAETQSEKLTAEVSTLRSELAVQTAAVENNREMAIAANERTMKANDKKDEYRNALTEAEAQVEIERSAAARIRGHRFKLLIATGVLLAMVVILGYLILKI